MESGGRRRGYYMRPNRVGDYNVADAGICKTLGDRPVTLARHGLQLAGFHGFSGAQATQMQYRDLGKTGLKVSALSLGCTPVSQCSMPPA